VACGGGAVVAAAVVGFLIERVRNPHVGASNRRVSCGGGAVVAAGGGRFLFVRVRNPHVGAIDRRVSSTSGRMKKPPTSMTGGTIS
jgi:hypothetical protein